VRRSSNSSVEREVKKVNSIRDLFIVFVIFGLMSAPAFAEKAAGGDYVQAKPYNPSYTDGSHEYTWADGEANRNGLPHWMADPDYWGDAEAAIFQNDLGVEVTLDMIRFMCTNDDTDSSYWGINAAVTSFTDMGAFEGIFISDWTVSGIYTAAEGYSGSVPTTWTEVDVSGEGVTIADGDFFAVAYGLDEGETESGSIGLVNGDTTGYTYSVFESEWYDDQTYDATGVLNAVVTYENAAVETASFGHIKGLYR
jgi:hypothetical protein